MIGLQAVYEELDWVTNICRDSYWFFCQEFWEEVPGAGKMEPNWHMELFANELQTLAMRVFRNEPKEYDLACNVAAGTSKSTIFSILFQPWTWTVAPWTRHLTASHTDALVLDLANKSRAVIKSEKYRTCFPHVQLRDDQDTKGYFANTAGGDRFTCTVGGKSPMGFHAHFLGIDDPLDPKKVLSQAEVKAAREFMTNVIPTRKVNKTVSVTYLVMQRLGLGDSTDVMLENSKIEGAGKVRHILLPGEISVPKAAAAVNPPELKDLYTADGLMDDKRLNWQALRELRAKGDHFYFTQVLQLPYAISGGMFSEEFFNQRVKAAPYDCQRICYWDRAATEKGGCYTAGVLLGRSKEGDWYIGPVTHGQWEPRTRNQKMRAVALRDRTKFGPKHEPIIWIEDEGGSSGKDAAKSVVAALAGFNVQMDRVTGDKYTRAEPWSSQCAAGNVYIVDDGTWDVNGYIQEHLAFRPDMPAGLKDRVDASSGAFNKLVGMPIRTIGFRVLTPGRDATGLRIVICSKDELANLMIDHRCLLVSISNPTPAGLEVMQNGSGGLSGNDERSALLRSVDGQGKEVMCSGDPSGQIRAKDTRAGSVNEAGRDNTGQSNVHTQIVTPDRPLHALDKLLDCLSLQFGDFDPADYQERWNDLVTPYDKPIADLIMNSQHGKRLWAFLLKKRQEMPQIFVIQDDGDRRALSIALAVCDVLRLKREQALWRPGGEWKATEQDKPPNPHVYSIVQTSRAMVI